MKKVISFGLWGTHARYNIGAIKNAELALVHYPEFECWFYIHTDTVPKNIIDQLQNMPNTKLILRSGYFDSLKLMTWRFESIDDPEVEINLSRDTDTRILLREKLAVDEWLNSGKLFHIMRDHPHHINRLTPIMGGMFGTRKLPLSWKQSICDTVLYNTNGVMFDQGFLAKIIYPLIINSCVIHSSFGTVTNESNVKCFPIPYDEQFNHVGGYVYEDESVSIEHVNILRSCVI